jgi:hypothetical protein
MGFLSLEILNSLRKKGILQELTKQTEWILGYWQTKTAALQSSMVFRFTSSFQNLPVFFRNPLLSLLSLLPYKPLCCQNKLEATILLDLAWFSSFHLHGFVVYHFLFVLSHVCL